MQKNRTKLLFRPLKYKKYADKSCQKLNEFQNDFRKKYDTDNYKTGCIINQVKR